MIVKVNYESVAGVRSEQKVAPTTMVEATGELNS